MKVQRSLVVSLCAGVLSGFTCMSLLSASCRAAGAKGQNEEPPVVTCSPERPSVKPDDTIAIRAWHIQNPTCPGCTWTATGGKISGQGNQQSWSFKDVMPGLYRATVKVKAPSGVTGECTIQVFVQEDRRLPGPPARDTGRSFLTRGKNEEDGYGLYSYILFGSPPTDSSRPRYLAAIEAYTNLIPKIEDLEAYRNRDRSELNVTYLPLDTSPSINVQAQWIIDHYDYARARLLLDKLPGDYRNGPYIISTLKPLGQNQNLSSQYLFQDLSLVPSSSGDLASWWVREFLSQAAQENFWEERTCQRLVLRLRTTIAVLAKGIPAVRAGLSTAIGWLH